MTKYFLHLVVDTVFLNGNLARISTINYKIKAAQGSSTFLLVLTNWEPIAGIVTSKHRKRTHDKIASLSLVLYFIPNIYSPIKKHHVECFAHSLVGFLVSTPLIKLSSKSTVNGKKYIP